MECVQPDAPIEKCCVCGTEIKTCEREEAVNGSYLCPAHPKGAQLDEERWVCSQECWDAATEDGVA